MLCRLTTPQGALWAFQRSFAPEVGSLSQGVSAASFSGSVLSSAVCVTCDRAETRKLNEKAYEIGGLITMPHMEERKLVKYLAVSTGFAVCLLRISTALSNILTGLSLLLALFIWYSHKDSVSLSEEVKGYMKAYGVFVLLTVPSVFFSDKPVASIKAILDFWIWRYALFVIIAAFIHRREYLVNMLTAFLTVISVDCLYTLVQVLDPANRSGRGFGFAIGNGSSLSVSMCMLLPIVMVILMDSGFEKKLKRISAFSVISILVGLLCNKSRGSWLTVPIVVPVATFRYLKQNIKYLAVVLAVLLGITAFMASSPRHVQRVKSITNTTTFTSNTARISVWKSSLAMIRDHPVTGIGADRFAAIYRDKKSKYNYGYIKYIKYKYKGKYKYKRVKVRSKLGGAHNNFLHITAECGIIGLAGFLYFVGYYLYSSLRNYLKYKNPYDILVFTTVFGYICLYGQISYSLNLAPGIRIMWFILAVLLKMKETTQYKPEG